ncbi:50S ribosomal protein L15 [Mangrovicoccus ximenensis]|uniref:50S ribosomal protein L15 n=1 Tax=Mangrovicoccus ximenensis TaxID=1911570 RepID=UPI000D3CA49B|nr:50S ribosomal protein L15 [Mangrovicoccus ximenensis]
MKLHELRDNPGAARKAKRIGRGPGSGKGKMGGRGIKGQKSRSGVAINGYEGGQMPLYMRLPKRGFNKPNRKSFAVVNLGVLQKFIEAGKIDSAQPVTEDVLVASGLVRRKLDGIRVLGKLAGTVDEAGNLTETAFAQKIDLQVTAVSASAKALIEQAGGSVTVTAPAAPAAEA